MVVFVCGDAFVVVYGFVVWFEHGDDLLFVFEGGFVDLVLWLCGNGFVDPGGDVLVNGVECGDGFVDVIFGGSTI